MTFESFILSYCFLIGTLAFGFSTWALIAVYAMKNSTHTIQWKSMNPELDEKDAELADAHLNTELNKVFEENEKKYNVPSAY